MTSGDSGSITTSPSSSETLSWGLECSAPEALARSRSRCIESMTPACCERNALPRSSVHSRFAFIICSTSGTGTSALTLLSQSCCARAAFNDAPVNDP
jgi:hypothetical protein